MSAAALVGLSTLIVFGLIVRGFDRRRREHVLRGLDATGSGRRSRVAKVPLGIRRVAVRGAAALGAAAVGFPLLGPVGAVGGALLPWAVDAMRRAHRTAAERDLRDRQLLEAVAALAAALRSGLSLRRAVAEAARDAEPPLRGALDRTLRRIEAGEPLDIALQRLQRSLDLSDAALIVTALAVHRKTGGDLPRLLDEIRAVMRARLEERATVRALTAQARTSGVVLAVLPIAFVALLSGTGGDGLGAFYRTPFGVTILLVALACQAAGFVWMRALVARVEHA